MSPEGDDRPLEWPRPSVGRADLMTVIDDFAGTPGGRRVLHTWAEHELLADALALIAEGPRVDALLLRPRDLAAAFGTDLFENLNLDEHARALLPDVIAAFVPYAHALRGLPMHDTAASLGVIDSCRASFIDPFEVTVTGFDPWRRSFDGWRPFPPMTIREQLVSEVGSEEALEALTVEPLPEDEALDLSAVAADVRDRLRETVDLADPVVLRVFGPEHRTAVRRLLVDAVAADPEILRRKGRTVTLAAGACLSVARADCQLGPQGIMRVTTLAEQFGLTGAPASRELTLQRAVVGRTGYGHSRPLPSRYLTGRRRSELVRRRDQLAAEKPVREVS